MKVLQLIQKKQLRGAEVFAAQLSQHLQQQGHQIEIITLLDGDQKLPFSGTIHVLGARLGRRFTDFKAWKAIAKHVERFQPDIVQANASDTLKYAVLSKLLFGWKAKLVFRNANKISDFLNTPIKRWLNSFFVKHVDAVASVSEECRKDFVQAFSTDGLVVETLPIGIEDLQGAPYTDLTELGLPLNNHILLHVAGFVPEKNHVGLLRIFEQLKEHDPALCLLMIGEGRLKEQIQQIVSDRGLQDSVVFAGLRRDVLQIMPACKALLMPSLIEGLPGVILEAFKSRLPVVAYETGGISEVLTTSTGWPVPEQDEEAFIVRVISLLKSDIESINEKTEAAYDLVSLSYQNKEIAKRFEKMYEMLF